MYVVVMTYIWIGRSWIYLYILRYCSAACIYFSFRWGPFMHSLEIVQWDSTRRDHPGYPGRVSGSGLVTAYPRPKSSLCHLARIKPPWDPWSHQNPLLQVYEPYQQ